MTISVEWRNRGSIHRLSGRVTLSEVRSCVFEYGSDARADHARYKVVDLLAVEDLDVSTEQLELLGAYEYGHTLSTPNVRLAYVSDGRFDEALKAFGTLLAKSSWIVRVFGDHDEALDWAQSGEVPKTARAANSN